MSANFNLVDESVDDGIPSNFLNEFLGDMDNLGLKVSNDQTKTAQIVQERLKKFNEAWHIPPSSSETPSTSAISYEPQPGPSRVAATPSENKQEESIPNEFPAQTAKQSATTAEDGLLGSPSSLQIVEDAPRPSTSTDGLRGRVSSNSRAGDGGRHSVRRRRSFSEDDDGEEDDYEYYRQRRAARSRRHRSRYHSRSRTPPESRRPRPFRSRSPPRSRSRFANRSPPRRQRSRTPARSRSLSRDSRSSRSSERERRHRRRNHSRADPPAMQGAPTIPAVHNVAVMAQTMMSMMQMFNQCAAATNPMQPVLPLPFGNLLQTGSAGLTPPILMNPPVPSTAASTMPMSAANEGNTTQAQPQQPAKEDVGKASQYDGTTELFLEGRMHFGQYLRENPSCMVQQKVNPRVCERIKDAIRVLERQETKEQTVKFLYVPPYYYSETRKRENRSPLIWNDQNVLFRLTSSSREVKHCEPFGNVNGKLKGLIAKLGLDEGAISQQLQKDAYAPANSTISERGSSSRIQAISTLPPKPGSARVRHMIERAAQTEGYACGECVERAKKTFVSSRSQTMSTVPRMADAAIQTPSTLDRNPFVPSITLENLTASQIETIEAIVSFIRTRHVTGPVDAVQHALSKDSTARITMGSGLFQTAQDVMSMMTEKPRPAASSYASSSASSRYVVSIQQHVQSTRAATSTNFQPQIPPPTPPTAGGRYFQPFNNQASILPACFAPQQHMSRKAKKKLNKR
uniref:Uncharacterized protein n=1 Tax=Anopheles atroparvus TaxID=41427 RepID=A0A182IU75_ANOAO